jgi:hypothetical protein
MAQNLIPIIADHLNVEIGEEFNVTDYAKTIRFKFDETGLLWIDECEKEWTYTDLSTFFRLINGDNEVIKLPFEPRTGQVVWTYWSDWKVTDFVWDDKYTNFVFRKFCGCVFRTEAEAIAALPEKFYELTGNKWEEKSSG